MASVVRVGCAALLGFLAWAAAAAAAHAQFAGSWETTYGRMELDQLGDQVTGTYEFAEGSAIEGTVANGRLTFRYTEPSASGEGWFEISADGQSFSGEWRSDGGQTWIGWDGARVIPTFTGLWDTSYGLLDLTEQDGLVVGVYEGGGVLDGEIMHDGLRFRYVDSSGTGEGVFRIAADGRSFTGEWRPDDGQEWTPWEGVRTVDASTFAGAWDTTYGRMELTQVEDRVHGYYEYGSKATIGGTVEGSRLTFRYIEPTATGEGWFELSEDGASFAGEWRQDGADAWSPWTGQRAVAAAQSE